MLDSITYSTGVIRKANKSHYKELNRMNLNVIERNKLIQETVTQNKLAYSIEQISAQTSLSKAFLRLEIKRGNLKAVRPGNSRRVIITAKSLEDYLNGGNDEQK